MMANCDNCGRQMVREIWWVPVDHVTPLVKVPTCVDVCPVCDEGERDAV